MVSNRRRADKPRHPEQVRSRAACDLLWRAAMWAEATQAVNEFGTMIKSPNGYPVQSPWVAILNRSAEVMLRIAAEFGFSPAARSRHLLYTKQVSMLLDRSNEPKTGLDLCEPLHYGVYSGEPRSHL